MREDVKKAVTKDKLSFKKEFSNKYNRTFSEQLKRKIVSDFEKKLVSMPEICDLYDVTRTSVYRWVYKYSSSYQSNTKTVVQMDSEETKTRLLYQENAELLRIIGQKQVELDYLNQLIAQAGAEFQVDLKKNFGFAASNGFKTTPTSTHTE